MRKLARQTLTVMIAASALGFGLAGGAPAQDSGGRHVPPRQRQSGSDNRQPERISAMQIANQAPEVKLPPLDTAVPARTETAAFGLG